MSWYKKAIKKHGKEIVVGGISSLVFSMSILLWWFLTGNTFEWQKITPLSEPSIFIRVFYSALTFVTLGAFLYKIKFYKLLYWASGDWRSFKEAKSIIWLLLLGLMFFVIVPKFFTLLNFIISFGFNILNLILYIFPALGITLILGCAYLYISKQSKGSK